VTGAPSLHRAGDNITSKERVTGTSKSYTVSRLRREAPALYEEVKEGRLSANSAERLEPEPEAPRVIR
jgi:hypothetical protein